jgi:cytochrome c peroxidase
MTRDGPGGMPAARTRPRGRTGPGPGAIATRLCGAVALVLAACTAGGPIDGARTGLPAASAASGSFDWRLPDWVPRPVVPDDNPMSADTVELGRHLFHDTRLSSDRTMSCATCHHPEKAFTDGRARSPGVTGELGPRSAMSLANVAYLPVLTWQNPQLDSLEVQALIPIFGEHPVEMGMAGRERELFERLRAEPVYRRLFPRAFPAEAARGDDALYGLATITRALAAFQRTLLSVDSPWDRYRYGGEPDAIPESAKRGEALFFGEKLECYHCHGGFNFTDNLRHARLPFPERGFHNTGLYDVDGAGSYPSDSPGIVEFTGDPRDRGRFRTPTLRNVAVTAPYMHDGSIATLPEVLRTHYARAGRASLSGRGPNPLRSELIAGFELDEQEIADVVAFLETLTDETFLGNPRFGNPWTRRSAGPPTTPVDSRTPRDRR